MKKKLKNFSLSSALDTGMKMVEYRFDLASHGLLSKLMMMIFIDEKLVGLLKDIEFEIW